MPQTSFEIDDKTSHALEKLKRVYGVTSNAAAVKRALAIALIASEYADPNHNIHLVAHSDKGDDGKEVILPQRY